MNHPMPTWRPKIDEQDTPVSFAFAHMFPHGRAARLAARILSEHDLIAAALTQAIDAADSTDRGELLQLAALVEDFTYAVAQETKDTPPASPLTGTSARSIVHTLADSITTMPEPRPGTWREAARKQIEKTGSNYVQIWKNDATYHAYARQGETGGN